MDAKRFPSGMRSSRLSVPASARRKSSNITGTFMVLAAWNEVVSPMPRVVPVARSWNQSPTSAPGVAAMRCRRAASSEPGWSGL